MDPQVSMLLRIVDEAYSHQAWHGPNLRGALRGLSPHEAAWRPEEARHNIWEVALHCAYWKYAVRRRILGLKRGSFVLKGSNWFARLDNLTAARWRSELHLLDEEHHALRETIAALPLARLKQKVSGGPTRIERLIYGIAAHDVYHAGQIQLMKRLYRGMQ